ncbi:MAG: hypothetical protein ACQR33_00695 [Candidatus Saccharibacteria bacterium]
MSYEDFPYDQESDQIDAVDAYWSMRALRDQYELLSAETSALQLVRGAPVDPSEPVFGDGAGIWLKVGTIRTPHEASAMLGAFSEGSEASRSLVAMNAPHFIFKGLVSYHEGMSHLVDAVTDPSADVVEVAQDTFDKNRLGLLNAARASGDDLAPLRLKRILNGIPPRPTPPSSPPPAPKPTSRYGHLSAVA